MEPMLTPDFFDRPALDVAPDLIGRRLAHRSPEGTVAGVVVEAEAYTGTGDPASHAYGGRRTKRNEVMWGPPGHAYIYPIYGIYLCFNVVCAGEGDPQGVFLRAVRPTEGLPLMAARRGLPSNALRELCSGPSRLCQAFGITRTMNGMEVNGGELFFTEGEKGLEVISAPRIGVDYAGPGRWWPYRFLAKGDPFVSRPR